MEIEHRTGQLFRVLLRMGLAIIIPLYLVAVFINRELGLVDMIERPLILTALLLILSILVRIERHLHRDDTPELTVYDDRSSLYEATRKAVENARRRVYVTYLRSRSPLELDAAVREHFKACRKWASSSEKHVFRRVVINADNPSMLDYLRQEHTEVRRARENGRHYNVKVLRNVLYDSRAISIGIYDDEQVFLTYAADTDNLIGIGIRSRKAVRECFEHYYNHLWSTATDLDECLAGSEILPESPHP
jgi:hypothetical protein